MLKKLYLICYIIHLGMNQIFRLWYGKVCDISSIIYYIITCLNILYTRYYLLNLEISMQDKANHDDGEGSKINLPSQSSNKLIRCLFDIFQELNRVGSPTLHEVNVISSH